MREKVGKSRHTVFFQWFVAPEGRKVGSLKRRVRRPAGQMRHEKLHAVVVRSTFRSQKCKKLTGRFFPHIQGFKSNQGSHVILVALICSINIEPFRKNRESKKLNLALGLRVTSNSATLKFTREEPPSGLLALRMPEPTVDPRTIEIRVGPWFCDRTYLSSTRLDLRWILLCPNTFCDGSYIVQH